MGHFFSALIFVVYLGHGIVHPVSSRVPLLFVLQKKQFLGGICLMAPKLKNLKKWCTSIYRSICFVFLRLLITQGTGSISTI